MITNLENLTEENKQTISDIVRIGKEVGVSDEEIDVAVIIANSESSLRPEVRSNESTAWGTFQYLDGSWPSTWKKIGNRLKDEELDFQLPEGFDYNSTDAESTRYDQDWQIIGFYAELTDYYKGYPDEIHKEWQDDVDLLVEMGYSPDTDFLQYAYLRHNTDTMGQVKTVFDEHFAQESIIAGLEELVDDAMHALLGDGGLAHFDVSLPYVVDTQPTFFEQFSDGFDIFVNKVADGIDTVSNWLADITAPLWEPYTEDEDIACHMDGGKGATRRAKRLHRTGLLLIVLSTFSASPPLHAEPPPVISVGEEEQRVELQCPGENWKVDIIFHDRFHYEYEHAPLDKPFGRKTIKLELELHPVPSLATCLTVRNKQSGQDKRYIVVHLVTWTETSRNNYHQQALFDMNGYRADIHSALLYPRPRKDNAAQIERNELYVFDYGARASDMSAWLEMFK